MGEGQERAEVDVFKWVMGRIAWLLLAVLTYGASSIGWISRGILAILTVGVALATIAILRRRDRDIAVVIWVVGTVGLAIMAGIVFPLTFTHIQDSLPPVPSADSISYRASVLIEEANTFLDSGSFRVAREVYLEAVSLLHDYEFEDKNRTMSAVLNKIGYTLHCEGQHSEAVEYYQQGYDIAEKSDDIPMMATSKMNIGVAMNSLGERDVALASHQEALALQEEVGLLLPQARTWNEIGFIQAQQGLLTSARESYLKGLDLAKIVDDQGTQGLILSNLGVLFLESEHPGRAASYLEQALEAYRMESNLDAQSDVLLLLIEVYYEMDELSRAISCCQEEISILQALGYREAEINILEMIGVFHQLSGDNSQAREAYECACELAEELQLDARAEELRKRILGLSG